MAMLNSQRVSKQKTVDPAIMEESGRHPCWSLGATGFLFFSLSGSPQIHERGPGAIPELANKIL